MAKLVGEKKEKNIETVETFNTDYSGVTGVFMFLMVSMIIGITYLIGKNHFFGGYSILNDLIIEESAIGGLNKTGEWSFFWGLLIAGSILCVLFVLWTVFCVNRREKKEINHIAIVTLPVFFPALLKTILYGEKVSYLWYFSIVLYLLLVLFKEYGKKYAALFLFLYFDGQFASFMTSRFRTIPRNVDWYVFLIALVLSSLIILFHQLTKSGKDVFKALFITLQFPLPMLLLVYTKNEYKVGNVTSFFPYPNSYIIFLFVIILLLFGGIIAEYFIEKKKEETVKSGIFLSSAISIFLFTSYLPGAMVVQSDMHHHGEQMLPWQQIVNFGSKAYEDYFPVSGLFSMLIGGVNQLFFGNKATTYAISFIIVFILFAILTIAMIRLSSDAYLTLLFAFIFQMPAYCRTWLLLPGLLLMLFATKLKNKRKFIYIYIFTSFLAGLYYPLFGMALVLAGFPYFLAVLIPFLKSKSKKSSIQSELKNKWFYVESIVVFVPILISIPLLYRMAKHVLAYQSQTLLGDGLPLLSTELPKWFMAWGNKIEGLLTLRTFLYYGIRFLGPMVPVWFLLLLLCRYIANNKRFHTTLFFGITAPLLTLIMSYRYTIVIQDEDWVSHLFSRSSHVFLWVVGIFVPIIIIYYGKDLHFSKVYQNVLIGLCISFVMICFVDMGDYQFPTLDGTTNSTSNVVGEYSKNFEPYKLNEDMVSISSVDNETFENLGEGFINIEVLSNLYSYKYQIDQLRKADPEVKILGLDSYQMYYFLLGEDAVYSGKVSLAKSKKTEEMVIPLLDEHVVIGSDVKPLYNFYIYKELMNRGYIYDDNTDFTLSKELYVKMYGEEMYNLSIDNPSIWNGNCYMVKAPSSLGASLSNLVQKGILEQVNIENNAKEIEFCYAEVDRDELKQVFGCNDEDLNYISISWDEEVHFIFDFDNGKWLIPLGMNHAFKNATMEDVYLGLYDGGNGTEILRVNLLELVENITYYKTK